MSIRNRGSVLTAYIRWDAGKQEALLLPAQRPKAASPGPIRLTRSEVLARWGNSSQLIFDHPGRWFPITVPAQAPAPA